MDTKPRIYWENILVLVVVHVLGAAGLLYAGSGKAAGPSLALGAFWLVLCVLSTTGGYHRLFAHRTYRAAKGLRLFYLLFGAASGQGSALRWSADHRAHHAHTDEDGDPYNVRRGFWWAHLGWLLYRSPPPDLSRVKDLLADPLIRAQNRFYVPWAVVIGFVVPMLLAGLWKDPWGGLLLAGFLRLAIQYQATFSINSVAHWVGRRPYARDTSARDSALAAILTLGEGYHNYHHRFPGDYRNGVKWHHFDPTKWWVWLMAQAGLAWDLRKAPEEEIRRAKAAAAAPRSDVPRARASTFRSTPPGP